MQVTRRWSIGGRSKLRPTGDWSYSGHRNIGTSANVQHLGDGLVGIDASHLADDALFTGRPLTNTGGHILTLCKRRPEPDSRRGLRTQ